SSEYATDAKQRIIFIRERLANYDLKVAQYYVRRGIHIAAANRAKNILEKYPDTQAARQALDILQISYTGMGMHDLAADISRVKQAN
ncbi:MAG: outer membrane protein assembly factor BamD, partial [Gammaproteobacteria bacterium]|nr:outer membrane protein assembly factor BamD [Gammaproteobacteria bacterium]